MSDRIDAIAVFVQVVESGNFSAAAQHLHLTRSAVGKIVAGLEQRLGARLFQRTTRQQKLTEEGQLFYEHSLRIMAELREAEAAVESGRREPSGRLRVSVPIVYGRLRVAPLLTALVHRHSGLKLEMNFTDQVVDLIHEGFDLAVRIGPLVDSSSLVARRFATNRMVICGAPEYFAKYGRPESLTDLANHFGILYGRPGYEAPWRAMDEHQQIKQYAPASRLLVNDLEVIAEQALMGRGMAYLPCWLVQPYLNDGRLELALDESHAVEHGIFAVWPKANYLPSKTRAAIDCLVSTYAEYDK
ncbi:MAG: LysR family transcriptional regulator [bacterium]